jgi:hypothetical protein
MFKELLKQSIDKEDLLILEFANLGPKLHKFGVDVNFHIMQPTDRKLQHGPRIKVYVSSWTSGDTFSITISNIPKVIGEWKSVVSSKELKILLSNVKKYRVPLLEFWNTPSMTVDVLVEKMEEIRNYT